MVSYVPKSNKSVVLLSSMHHDKTVSNKEHRKPEIILFYNSTKGGVDTIDQMVRYYSCRIKTRRWPLAFFMNCRKVRVYHPVFPVDMDIELLNFQVNCAKINFEDWMLYHNAAYY